jgi:hypothetical protein
LAQKLAQLQPFISLYSHRSAWATCIFWANLIPFAHQVKAEGYTSRAEVKFEVDAAVKAVKAAVRAEVKAELKADTAPPKRPRDPPPAAAPPCKRRCAAQICREFTANLPKKKPSWPKRPKGGQKRRGRAGGWEAQVRKTPSWPRSWANFNFLSL